MSVRSRRFYAFWAIVAGAFEATMYLAGIGFSQIAGIVGGFLLIFVVNVLIYLQFVADIER